MTRISPTLENLCAVIVTYYPDNSFSNRLNVLLHQLKCAVVVDNCSDEESREMLRRAMVQGQAQIIFNQENVGVAAALNQGIRWAKKQGFHWILTLDQDSCLENSAVETFIKTYEGLDNKEKIAMIGLNHTDTNSGQLYHHARWGAARKWVERKTLITSGSFMSVQTFDNLGPFREELFIDGVDHEYCLRARQKGYQNILILNPLLKHAMGHRAIIQSSLIRWMKIPLTNYPAFRWYFMVRNRLVICRKYLKSDSLWSVSRFGRLLGSLVLMLLFEKGRGHKFKLAVWGFKDGVTRDMNRKIIFSETILS
jgi:rhamnosyltransferase